MISRINALLSDRRGSLAAVGLGFFALVAIAGLAVVTYNDAAQTKATANIRQLTVAVESRANHYTAELDANLVAPAAPTTTRECSVNPGVCTQILSATSSPDGTSRALRIQADAVDADITITRDITVKSAAATHVTALDAAGRPTWADTDEAHGFTIWGVVSGSITKVSPDQMPGPTEGTQWVLATTNGGIDNTGQLWAYGPNTKCEAGTGSASTSPLAPTKLNLGVAIRSIVVGTGSTFYLDASGQAWAVGDNSRGQLGIGRTNSTCTPTRIPNHRFIALSSAGATTVGIDTAGALFAWGDGTSAQIGDGAAKNYSAPVQIAAISRFTAVATSGTNTFAIDVTRKLWAWGSNSIGQLGYGQPGTPYQTPGPVNAPQQFTSVATGANTAYAIDTTGKLWAWGANDKGQVGDGTLTRRTVPTTVSASGVYTSIAAAGSRAFATDAGGQVWAWGDNSELALALTTPGAVVRPTQLQGMRSYSPLQVSPAGSTTALLDSDKVLWAIGTANAGLWPADFEPSTGKPIRMPRPDGFAAPSWK